MENKTKDWEEQWDEIKNARTRIYSLEESGEFSPKIHKYLETLLDTEKPRYDSVLRLRLLRDYFEPLGGFPEEFEDRFVKKGTHKCGDPILENLQTHDVEKLKAVLNKKFGGLFTFLTNPEELHGKKVFRWIPTKANFRNKEVTKEVQRIADFFGYSINRHEDTCTVDFEPIYPESGSSYVYGPCEGQVYHLSPKGTINEDTGEIDNEEIADAILRNGLRIKNGPTEIDPETGKKRDPYRYFPERIYVLAFEVSGINIKRELQRICSEVTGLDWNDVAAFKINVRHLPYTFYKDTAMPDNPHAFFTYNNIPPGLITRIH